MAFGFVALIVMARELTPPGFGLVVVGTTLVQWFRIVVDSGTEVIGSRDISREPERFQMIAGPTLGLRLALSAGAALLLAAGALAFAEGSDRQVIAMFALLLPMVALNLRWMVLGVGGAKGVAAGNVAGQALILAGVLLLVHRRHDVIAVPGIQAVGELVYGAVVLGAVARRFGLVRPQIDLGAWRAMLRASLPLMGSNVARAVLYSFDVLVIALLLSREDVGLYGAAYKPILFLTGVLGLYSLSFLSSYSAAAHSERGLLSTQALRTVTAATVPVAVLLSVGAGPGLELVYGDGYRGATVALAILAWSVPLLAVATPYANILIVHHHGKMLMRHNLVAAAAAIVATVVAVPLAGIAGAAAVTVAAFALVMVLNYRAVVGMGVGPSVRDVVARPPRPVAQKW